MKFDGVIWNIFTIILYIFTLNFTFFVVLMITSDFKYHWYGWHRTSKKGNRGENKLFSFLKSDSKMIDGWYILISICILRFYFARPVIKTNLKQELISYKSDGQGTYMFYKFFTHNMQSWYSFWYYAILNYQYVLNVYMYPTFSAGFR